MKFFNWAVVFLLSFLSLGFVFAADLQEGDVDGGFDDGGIPEGGEITSDFCSVNSDCVNICEVLGDFDGNGVVNGLDIPGFKSALANTEEWCLQTGRDANLIGDFDGNGVVNGLDIPGFKSKLSNSDFEERCYNFCDNGVCVYDSSMAEVQNKKNIGFYSDKELFFVSDKNWQDVLPWVPVSVWTQQEGVSEEDNCQRGYGTPEDVCVYPFLMWHEEEYSYHINYSVLIDKELYYNYDVYEDKILYKINNRFYLYNFDTGITQLLFEGFANDFKMWGDIILLRQGDDISIYNINTDDFEVIHTPDDSRAYLDNLAINNNYISWTETISRLSDIYLYNLDTQSKLKVESQKEIRASALNSNYLFWSEKGQYNSIVMYNLFTQRKSKINREGLISEISADDNYLIWRDFGYAYGEIFLYNLDNNLIERVTNNYNTESSFKINNGNLLWSQGFAGDSQIFKYNIKDKQITQITNDLNSHYNPNFVGDEIIFCAYDSLCRDGIYIYNGDNGVYGKIDSFDADSIIEFIQPYFPSKVSIIGNSPQELDDLLIAEPELGAGLTSDRIQRLNPNNYLGYWNSYKDVVYVEEDYELALLASTYASLINAPLVISNNEPDNLVLDDKNIICVGSVNIGYECDDEYNLEELQQKYFDETNTGKIILINPQDLEINLLDKFQPKKSTNPIMNIYTKTSLSSPILASAKHELILSVNSNEFSLIDNEIDSKLNSFNSYGGLCKTGDSCSSNFITLSKKMLSRQNNLSYYIPEDFINENNNIFMFYGAFGNCDSDRINIKIYNNDIFLFEGDTLCRDNIELITRNTGNVDSFEISKLYAGELKFVFEGGDFYLSENPYHKHYFQIVDDSHNPLFLCSESSCVSNLDLVNVSTIASKGESIYNLDVNNSSKNRLIVKSFAPSVDNISVYNYGDYVGLTDNRGKYGGSAFDLNTNNISIRLIPHYRGYVDEEEKYYYSEVYTQPINPPSKYLTIFGSHIAIQDSISSGFESRDTVDWRYSSSNDLIPEMNLGRIMGISSSDVSSYIARSVFYDELFDSLYSEENYNALSIGHSRPHYARDAEDVISILSNSDYQGDCFTDIESLNCKLNKKPEMSEYLQKQFISFADHGSEYWWGYTLSYDEIPKMDLAFTIAKACSPSNIWFGKSRTFSSNIMRRNIIANSGATGTTPALPGRCSLDNNSRCYDDFHCLEESKGVCVSKGLPGSLSANYVLDNPNLTLGELYYKLSLNKWLSFDNGFKYYQKHLFLGDPTLKPRWIR